MRPNGRTALWTTAMACCLSLITAPAKADSLESFCDRLPRSAYSIFQKHPASTDWFEVYEIEPNVFALYEPFQWQEVISYLIVGERSAVLFDTGNGMSDIAAVVARLTDLPIIVLNSHSHTDHVGGNYAFDDIRSVDAAFSKVRRKGMSHEQVAEEVSAAALCKGLPDGLKAEDYRIKPFTISDVIADGDTIDIGGRLLEVLLIPGHTTDSIAMLDRQAGLLWTGDSFYAGPIWLYADETDFDTYRRSLVRLAALVPSLKRLLPAHNTPSAAPF
ncbi:MAG: MBL fold metallo-hydrolase, partial [Woeseiaceae bacterium]